MEIKTKGDNPLRKMLENSVRGEWMPIRDFCAFLSYAMAFADYQLTSFEQQAIVMEELKLVGFIEHDEDNFNKVRVVGSWYDAV